MSEELIKTYGGYALGVLAGLSWAWEKFSKTRTNVAGDNLRRATDETLQMSLSRSDAKIEAREQKIEALQNLIATQRTVITEHMLKNKDQQLELQRYKAKIDQYRVKNQQLMRMMSAENKANQYLQDAYKPTDFSPLE